MILLRSTCLQDPPHFGEVQAADHLSNAGLIRIKALADWTWMTDHLRNLSVAPDSIAACILCDRDLVFAIGSGPPLDEKLLQAALTSFVIGFVEPSVCP